MKRALIFGETGGIGVALANRLRGEGAEVTGLSRRDGLDLTDPGSVVADKLRVAGPFDLILDATGALEIEGAGPEKTIAAIDAGAMARQFAVNAIGPALILKHFHDHLSRDRRAVFATLSARVGSIGDNRLGGWISYRASKAALNQIVRTAAIEIARRRPEAIVVALHPGTVATGLTEAYSGRHPTVPPEVAAATCSRSSAASDPGRPAGFSLGTASRSRGRAARPVPLWTAAGVSEQTSRRARLDRNIGRHCVDAASGKKAGGGAALAPLANPTFRTFWLASLASNFGGLIQAVGAAWTMTSISGSADMVALVQASTTLPIMLFSLASGAVADTFNRRSVMLAAQLGMLVVSAALALCAYHDLLTPWLLLGFTFLIGCGVALNNPSWQASIGEIVPREDLPAAVALNSVGFNLSRSVGPAIGGAIVAAAGVAAAFAVNAVSYLAIIAALIRWRPEARSGTLPPENLGAAMGAGLRYVAMSPHIARVLLRAFLFGLTTIAVLALLPLVARHLVAGGALTYGLLLGAFGLGAVAGAFAAGRLRLWLSSEAIVRLAFAAFAICAAVAGVSESAALTAVALALGGASWVLALSLFNVTVQLSTPRWVVGRSLALYQTAVFGGMALGSWLWGLIAEAHGSQSALLAAAAAMLAGGLVGLAVPLPSRTELDLTPLDRWREPPLPPDLRPRSGPVAIEVEYRVRAADLPAFLDVMIDRQRIRRRDGARHWTLMRDLGDAELWTESYQTATWVEYVRHNLRTTVADSEIGERLRALHSGTDGPRVRRRILRQVRWLHAEPPPPSGYDEY